MSEARIRFYGTHAKVFHDTSRQIDVEGAVRSGKTTLCLVKVLALCQAHPGIFGLICRFSDDDTHSLLKPLWRAICDKAGVKLTWNAEESYDELDNGSRVYITGLKTNDQTNRFRKFRGLTLAFVYNDQSEELPHEIYQELVLRLSQNGYTHQMILSPQTVGEDHWIAKEFPHDRPLKPGRAYYALSTHDNAHNLPSNYIAEMEDAHAPGTPIHSTLILGQRGAQIVGDPVYGTPADGSRKGAFLRSRHEGPCAFDPRLRLEIGLDFGKHHPCVVARQVSVVGQVRFLGGILGQNLHLDPFLTAARQHLARWFPDPIETVWCCDPAGVSNPVGLDMRKTLQAHNIDARYQEDSNSPAVRVALIDRIAAQMRARALDGDEALRVSNEQEHWIRLSEHGSVTHRMVASAFESGYVWDPNMVSVGSKQMRKPKKDGWHEQPMNVVEYLEANFGAVQKEAPIEVQAPIALPARGGAMAWGA